MSRLNWVKKPALSSSAWWLHNERDVRNTQWEQQPRADPERGTGGPDPLKNHKNKGFLSSTGLDPLKITKLPIQHSMLGHHQHTSETPFKWRFTGGLMMPAYSGIWILTPLIIPWQNFLDPRMNNTQWTTINIISILYMININWSARIDTIYHLWETIKWSN